MPQPPGRGIAVIYIVHNLAIVYQGDISFSTNKTKNIMDNFSSSLLVILASSLTTTLLVMAAILLNRRHQARNRQYSYPVVDDPATEEPESILEDEAAEYDASAQRNSDLMTRFRALMDEQKPYLEKGITIEMLANSLRTNRTTLSNLINENFGMNYRQLLNSYRVKEAIMIFSRNKDISMEELRTAAGFKSIGTFTSSFTRFTGCTPGEYCKKAIGK